jgi:hypothetical protein
MRAVGGGHSVFPNDLHAIAAALHICAVRDRM